jgi:hypothetical protein
MRYVSAVMLASAAIALAGCSSRGKQLDEFAVARNAPLVIPPDYTLAPPAAGTATLSAGDAQAQAIGALFGGPAPRSAGETGMLERAGGERAALGVRSTAGDPATVVVDKGAVTQSILAAPAANSAVATATTP